MSHRKVFVKIKIPSGPGSGSWLYFGFQYQTYISCIEDTQQILFGSANSFESYCVHIETPRTYSQLVRQTDRQTDIFSCLFCLLRHTKHEYSSKGENFFFTHVITILSLFTYSVCDQNVRKNVRLEFILHKEKEVKNEKWYERDTKKSVMVVEALEG